MMDEAIATDEVVVVVVGKFNPAIVQPSWLALQGLVPPTEAEHAEVGIIHPAVSSFRCGDLVLQVDERRLQIGTTSLGASVLVRDLAIGILSILEHTPIVACGLNRNLHLDGGWAELAARLVSPAVAAGIVAAAEPASVQLKGRRPDAASGSLTVTLQPSKLLAGGVYYGFNEHHELTEESDRSSALRGLLQREWVPAQDHFLHAARELLASVRRTP